MRFSCGRDGSLNQQLLISLCMWRVRGARAVSSLADGGGVRGYKKQHAARPKLYSRRGRQQKAPSNNTPI